MIATKFLSKVAQISLSLKNVQKRMEAFGFQTITVEDGNDLVAIGKAIEEAKADKTRPSFITVRTQIGYGCPAKTG